MNNNEIIEAQKEIVKRGRPKGSLDSYKRPGRPDLSQGGTSKPEENRLYLQQVRWTASLPPIDTADPVQVENRINEYLNNCEEIGLKPTLTGMCNAVGISKGAVYTWEHGKYRQGTHQEVIVKYKRLLEEFWEIQMNEGKLNPITGIFLGKNHFGYADKQEVVLTPNSPFGDDVPSEEELKARYLESIPAEYLVEDSETDDK